MKLFRQLRTAWFDRVLYQHGPERDWEDAEQEASREYNNKHARQLFDEQTEMLLKGKDLPIAPTCYGEMVKYID